MVAKITQKRLRELLDYDPQLGLFFWRDHRSSRVRKGSIAGVVEENGYRRIKIGGVRYFAHRLVWLYVTGEWPDACIDHRDLNRDNNRFSNLRCASYSQNKANQRVLSTSRLGIKGVSYIGRGLKKPYRAMCMSRHIGYYPTPEEAHAAYLAAAQKYFGEFARGI